jgi:hypothetical protein
VQQEQEINTMTFQTLENDAKVNCAGTVIITDQARWFRVNITILFMINHKLS